MDWKEQYESAADREHSDYNAQPVAHLLRLVKAGHYGTYYSLWGSLAERSTLAEAGWLLFEVLQRDHLDFLIRCHAAEALLRLLGRTDYMVILEESVNLSRGTSAMREPYLTAMKAELLGRLKLD